MQSEVCTSTELKINKWFARFSTAIHVGTILSYLKIIECTKYSLHKCSHNEWGLMQEENAISKKQQNLREENVEKIHRTKPILMNWKHCIENLEFSGSELRWKITPLSFRGNDVTTLWKCSGIIRYVKSTFAASRDMGISIKSFQIFEDISIGSVDIIFLENLNLPGHLNCNDHFISVIFDILPLFNAG